MTPSVFGPSVGHFIPRLFAVFSRFYDEFSDIFRATFSMFVDIFFDFGYFSRRSLNAGKIYVGEKLRL